MRWWTKNCGVVSAATHVGIEDDYYEYLEEIIELVSIKDYRVVQFKCKWFDTDQRRKHIIYEHHFISIDTSREAYKEDHFVFATQVRQVFYIDDPSKSNPNWKMIRRFNHRHLWDILDDQEDVERLLDEIESPSDSRTISFEMTDFDNVAFDRDDMPAEVVDRAVVVEDDGSDNDIEVDETLEEYNDEPIIENDSDANNTITDCDVVQSDDDEEWMWNTNSYIILNTSLKI